MIKGNFWKMGTYTELVIKCAIKRDRPEIVHNVLAYMFAHGEKPEELPGHEFFKKEHWERIGSCNSYYHIPKCLNFYDGERLFSRSDFKNYYDEIDTFLDWLKPYICSDQDKCIGWVWVEQDDEPILIYNDTEQGDD